MAQTLDRASSHLTVTRFVDVTYDIGGLMAGSGPRGRSPEELPTPDLLRADPALAAELGTTPAVLLQEGHSRISNPLLGFAAPLIGFSALLLGTFSRFGLWRQVLGAVILLVHVVFLLVAGALVRLDLFELIIASNANVGGPTTAAAMAVARGRRVSSVAASQ
jgi:lipopolysaccharide export system permease protein